METIRKSLQAINVAGPDSDDEEEQQQQQQKHDPLRAGDRVLLTGANGFVGGHILKVLLVQGFKVKAVVGTRNEEMMVKRLCAGSEERVQIIIAGGIAGDKPKDVVRGVSGVIITACPYKNWDQRQESNIVGILDSICKHNPTIKRVILTSVMNDLNRDRESSDWDPTTALKASPLKTPIERAAWKYISANSPNFTLASVIVPTLFGPSAHDPPTTEPASEILRLIRGTDTVPVNTTGPWSDVRDVAKAHVAALMRGGVSGDAGEDRFFAVAGICNSKQICKVVERCFPGLVAEGRVPGADSVPGAFKEEEEDEIFGGRYEGDNRVTGELGVNMRGLEESVVDTVDGLLRFEERIKGHGKGAPQEAVVGGLPIGGLAYSCPPGSCTCGECATKMRHRRTSVDELDESFGESLNEDKDSLYTLVEQAYEGTVPSIEPTGSNIPRSFARGEALCACAPARCTCAGSDQQMVEERPRKRVSIVLNRPDMGEMLRHS
ncbi:NAD(P)-binding protein [Morchella conica CCBAS932]|uniref:NAD(P)-binding protein n=1 Tax=Morchella conica CCBAS932 TaxID=1392247 RepID=A0A3N4L7Z7_9PEZI|nr:NAD(P)-binding protein [Morchella conica CCBAS932]